MDKGTSLYFDVLRFSAAMVVFLSHLASQDLTDGFLWQFKAYAQTAVMVFFVMSGYVIAFVTQEKETSLTSYSIARVSRLYSVVIPALILTAICDAVGIYLNNDLYYQGSWPYPDGSQILHYILSFFLVQNIWGLDLNPGINGPFWSLTYEWFYYGLFAVFFFVQHQSKWLLILLLLLIAGPSIVALLPVWYIGYWLFNFQQKQHKSLFRPSVWLAILSLVPIVLIIIMGPTVRSFTLPFEWLTRGALLGDYFDTFMFVFHLMFARHLIAYIMPILERYQTEIRWGASLTFALYLFHRPIIQVIAAAYDGDQSNNIYRLVMFSTTLIFVAVIGRWCEQQKYTIKRFLLRRVNKQ